MSIPPLIPVLEQLIRSNDYGPRDLGTIDRLKAKVIFPHKQYPTRRDPLLYPITSFDNFYSESGHSSKGTCTEVSLQALIDLHRTNSDLFSQKKVHRAVGGDPFFYASMKTRFNPDGSINALLLDENRGEHYFLIISNNSLHLPEIKTGKDAHELLSHDDSILFDPWFRRAIPFKNSGYTIDRLFNYDNQDILFPKGPLLFSYNLKIPNNQKDSKKSPDILRTSSTRNVFSNFYPLGFSGPAAIHLSMGFENEVIRPILSIKYPGTEPSIIKLYPWKGENHLQSPIMEMLEEYVPGINPCVNQLLETFRSAQHIINPHPLSKRTSIKEHLPIQYSAS